jgi:hypothetical protein
LKNPQFAAFIRIPNVGANDQVDVHSKLVEHCTSRSKVKLIVRPRTSLERSDWLTPMIFPASAWVSPRTLIASEIAATSLLF